MGAAPPLPTPKKEAARPYAHGEGALGATVGTRGQQYYLCLGVALT